MKIPVDVKAVLDEATDIDRARQTPVFAAVYIDESAPAELLSFSRSAFAAASDNARVSMVYFPTMDASPISTADFAVVVAGLDPSCGKVAAASRAAGVPTMIVTTLPSLVGEMATVEGFTVPDGDLLSPEPATDAEGADSADFEPIALDEEARGALSFRMGEWVIDTCRDRRLAMALAFPFVRKPMALDAVRATSIQNAGVGLVAFIPGADLPIMTLNQAKMLLQVAAAYGRPLGAERVKELAAVVGGAFACRAVARQLVAFVPALGWAVKAAIGYSGTYAMGRAAIEYFEEDGGIENFARAVARARDKAVLAAEAAREQQRPSDAVKAAVAVVEGKARSAARAAHDGAVPFAKTVAKSAAQKAAGTDEATVRSVANAVSNAVTRRFTRK